MSGIKARILDEFERSKLKAAIEGTHSSERSRERLRQRRAGGKKAESKRGSAEEEQQDEMAFIAEIMGEAVDGLLDETTDATLSGVSLSAPDSHNQPSSRLKGKKKSSSSLSSSLSGYRSLEDITEKDLLLSKERGHQKELIDDLHAQMALRKSHLEERLRAKKQAASRGGGSSSGSGGGLSEAAEAEEDELKLKNINEAFTIVTDLVKGTSGSELKNMDLDSLLDLIDRALKAQDTSSSSNARGRAEHTADSSSAPSAYSAGYADVLEDINRLLAARRLGAGGGSEDPWGRRRLDGEVDEAEDMRETQRMRNEQYLQTRAKGLSSQYNVEKEKLDLRMKIEQARQQQTLQRKLLERRQSQQSQQVRLPLGAAGYSSSDGLSTSAAPAAAAAARRVVPPSEATTPIAQSGAQRHVAATGRAGYSDAAAGSLLAGMMARAARKDNSGGHASGGPGNMARK